MLSGLLDQYKKELNEFVATVKEDTSQALSSAADKLAHLGDDGEEEDAEDGAGARDKGGAGAGSGKKLLLAALPPFAAFVRGDLGQEDPGFEDFARNLDLKERTEQIDHARDGVAEVYEECVPQEMTHEEFWTKYFYFQHLQRRARLLAGDTDLHEQEEEDLTWDDDDDDEEEEDENAGHRADLCQQGEDGPAQEGEPSDLDEESDRRRLGSSGDEADAESSASGMASSRHNASVAEASNPDAKLRMRMAMAEEKAQNLQDKLSRVVARVAKLVQENKDLRHKNAQLREENQLLRSRGAETEESAKDTDVCEEPGPPSDATKPVGTATLPAREGPGATEEEDSLGEDDSRHPSAEAEDAEPKPPVSNSSDDSLAREWAIPEDVPSDANDEGWGAWE